MQIGCLIEVAIKTRECIFRVFFWMLINSIKMTLLQLILKSSSKSRDYIQKEKRGPYPKVSAIQASHDLVMKTRESIE